MKFGYEGLGLFYTILEKIALQEKPVKTDVLKKQLFVGKRLNKCWNFMEEIGIISSNNGETFNKQLLNFSEKYQIKKQKNAKRISEWRKNQADKENVTRYEHVCNTPKVKESKVKEIKEIKENKEKTFSVFWDSFHLITGKNKTDKEPTFKYWQKMTDSECEKANDNIKLYFDSLSDNKYCKKARTYLSDKNYNDEFKVNGQIIKPGPMIKYSRFGMPDKTCSLDEWPELQKQLGPQITKFEEVQA
jgi:hypothetical protein